MRSKLIEKQLTINAQSAKLSLAVRKFAGGARGMVLVGVVLLAGVIYLVLTASETE